MGKAGLVSAGLYLIELNHLSKYQLPSDLEIFLWKDLTQSEREEMLKRQKEQPWYPEILSPFHPDARLETIDV